MDIVDLIMVTAYCILAFTLWRNDKNGILTGSIAFNVLMGTYFFLLGSMAAAINCGISLVRSIYFKNNERRGKKNPLWSLIFFCVLVIGSVAITYTALKDLLIGVLALTGVIVYWFNGSEKVDSTTLIKFCVPIISICYIIYAIIIERWLVIPLEIIIITGGTFGGFKWLRRSHHDD